MLVGSHFYPIIFQAELRDFLRREIFFWTCVFLETIFVLYFFWGVGGGLGVGDDYPVAILSHNFWVAILS